ncbi:MAG: hypothetical protein J6V89_02930 [Acetobacter sp.]|nr:hypothetical protein [Acetobacter sp.]
MTKDGKNKGKEGEMELAKILADMSRSFPCDFIRLTTTNTPDMGADFFLEAPPGFVDDVIIPTANEKEPNITPYSQESSSRKSRRKSETTRIDRKTTSYKIGITTAKKFIQDCSKHPRCEKHMLMGGEDLTPKAKEIISSHPNARYVNNKGIEHLAYFFSEHALKEPENKNCLINKENDESES